MCIDIYKQVHYAQDLQSMQATVAVREMGLIHPRVSVSKDLCAAEISKLIRLIRASDRCLPC